MLKLKVNGVEITIYTRDEYDAEKFNADLYFSEVR